MLSEVLADSGQCPFAVRFLPLSEACSDPDLPEVLELGWAEMGIPGDACPAVNWIEIGP